MFDTCHPAFFAINQLGCSNPLKNMMAFQTYMELCEVKRLWDVQYKFNEDLNVIYLEARTSKSAPLHIYVPWPAMYSISIKAIECMQTKLKTDKLTLVFREADTTNVSYCATSGLVKPISPNESKSLKEKDEKKTELESEIRRNVTNLYELATAVKDERKAMVEELQVQMEQPMTEN